MSTTLLDQHRRNPTATTTRRLTAALAGEAKAVLRAHPVKSLPSWLSLGHLRDEVEAALERAVGHLAYIPVDYDRVADYVRGEIEAAIAPLFAPIDNQWLQRKRGHSRHAGGKREGRVEAVDGSAGRGMAESIRDGGRQPDVRDECKAALDRMFPLAKTQKQQRLIILLQDDAPLARIRAETKLRGPDALSILRRLFSRDGG